MLEQKSVEPQLQPPNEETVRLVTIGRKTGLPHIVELRFVYANRSFHVIGRGCKSDWVRNILSHGNVTVRVGPWSYNCVAGEPDPDSRLIRAKFERKYGSRIIKQWYSHAALSLELIPISQPNLRGLARGEFETASEFSEWKQENGPRYYEAVQEAFDSAADEYDYTISHNFINSWIRKRSIDTLLEIVKPNDTLVEIGCGTGAEAIVVAKHVDRIIATDISARMLEILGKKVRARNLTGKITLARARASEIANVKALLPNGTARVVYSFNGALNCEPRMHSVSDGLAKIIQPDGYFVCSIRNTICLTESLAHTLAFQPRRAFPRKKQPTMVSVGGLDIPAYYSSPSGFRRIFESDFELVKSIGLPAILPPAYLNNHYMKLRSFASSLFEKIDARVAGLFPFRNLGDQTLLIFRKLGETGA